MLSDKEAIATLAVHDLAVAKPFYQDVLGLELVDENAEALTFKAGGRSLFVYRSTFAGTNQGTAVTWSVGEEVDEVVRELGERGVKFEHYDMPMLKREGDLHIADGLRVAWFKDPDGNIHSVGSM